MLATPKIAFTDECHSFVSEQSTKKRDPPKRPPNAFMLYRSDFLKRRTVPPEVEKHQQNLSRIAGQCWNMLPDTEKAIWFEKAAVVRAEHRAKYPFYNRPSHSDPSKSSEKSKRRGSTAKPAHPSGRSRRRKTRTLYCGGMFSALHDPKFSAPESHASLFLPTSPSDSPLSTTASLSPIAFPHLLAPPTSPTPSIRQESPSASAEDSVTQGGKSGSPLDSPSSATPLCGPSLITPSKTSPHTEQLLTLQHYEDDLLSCVPRPGFAQVSKLINASPAAQVPPSVSDSSIFPTSPLTDYLSLLSNFSVSDDLTHFNQSFIPLYPWHSDKLDTSK